MRAALFQGLAAWGYHLRAETRLGSEKRNRTQLLEYIQNMRIEETKRRIREGADMKTLFEEAGFTNIAAFRRGFKKAKGVAPQRYYDHVRG